MIDPLLEISNSISDMGLVIGKGMVAMDALIQDYFDKPSDSIGGPSTHEINSVDDPAFAILNDYRRFQTIGEIAFDYFYDLEQRLDALDKRINEFRKESGTAAPDDSTLCSALAMLRQIKNPAAIKRIYDFAYRLHIKESAPAAPTAKADKQ